MVLSEKRGDGLKVATGILVFIKTTKANEEIKGMKWKDIRKAHPHQWIPIEALSAYTESEKRILEEITVLNVFPDPVTAMGH